MSHTSNVTQTEPNVARVKFTIRAFCHEVMVEARTWDEAERAAQQAAWKEHGQDAESVYVYAIEWL
jgi:hypothetical protein